jgi:ATP-dependent Lon protease
MLYSHAEEFSAWAEGTGRLWDDRRGNFWLSEDAVRLTQAGSYLSAVICLQLSAGSSLFKTAVSSKQSGTKATMGHWENIGLPEEFDGTVRLFPLPNLVLFPHVIQALHIFEPRYCDMLSEALESDHLITMALLEQGWESNYNEQPRLSGVVCIGRIISHSPTGDGRHNLFLAGIQRARILEELEVETPFRQAKVEIIEDIPFDDYSLEETCRDQLLDVFRTMIPKDAANSKTFSELLTRQLPLGTRASMNSSAAS